MDNEKTQSNNQSVLDAIEQLAIMTKHGFDHVTTELTEFREEFNTFKNATTETLFSLDNKVNDIDTRLKKVEEALEPLLTGYRIMQNEISDLIKRIEKLELKVGKA